MDLIEKLEEIKQLGSYALSFQYGEGIGCDDHDIKPLERRVTLHLSPVGVLGEARVVWAGPLGGLLEFNFRENEPKVLSNPPTDEEKKIMGTEGGYFVFGTEGAIKRLKDMWPLKVEE